MSERLLFTSLHTRSNEQVQPIETIDVFEKKISPFTESEIFFGTTQFGENVTIKFSKIPWGPRREWSGLQKAYNSGISTPAPYALIRSIEGKVGLVSQKIDGVNLYVNKDPALKRTFGCVVRRMHDRVPIKGNEWTKSGKADFSYYDKIIHQWNSLGLDIVKEGSIALELIKQFSQAAQDGVKKSKPVFAHKDLHNDQVFVSPKNELYLIDFELWKESNPFDDISIYLLHSLRTRQPREDFTEFCRGYKDQESYSEEEKMLISFFLLFSGGRGIDYFSRFRPKQIASAIDQLNRITTYISQEKLWQELS